jgi:hypothetical protein
MKEVSCSRRECLGVSALAGCSILLGGRGATAREVSPADDTQPGPVATQGSEQLCMLLQQLAKAPRRRCFKTVPMILDTPDLWDAEALAAVIAYPGKMKQVWDNSEIGSPWLNFMRNSLNTQVFSFRNANFLAISGTHGSAQLELYDEEVWDKYQLVKIAGSDFKPKTASENKILPGDAEAHENPLSVFGPAGNTVPSLQRRGVVFLACHNAIWEHAASLLEKGLKPARLSHEELAAELTNHLIEGVILTPGMTGTIPELQQAGFHYAK